MRPRVAPTYLLVASCKAVALVLIAWGLTNGIVSVVDGRQPTGVPILVATLGLVLRAATEWLGSVVASRDASQEKTALREQLLKRVLRHGRSDLMQTEGELAWVGTDGLDELDSWYQQVLPAMSSAAVTPLLLGAVIAMTDWVSALLILITLPLVPLFMWLIGTYTEDRVAQSVEAISRLSAHIVELARGLPALVGLHRSAEQVAALSVMNGEERQRTMQTLRTAFLSSLALELISTLSVALVAVFIGVRLVHGSMTLSDGLFVLLLAPECFNPLRQLGAAYHAAENGTAAADRVRQLGEDQEPISASDGGDVLYVRDLTVRYSDRQDAAVTNVSFQVRPGEIVSLAGPSGVGKSTVLGVIAGTLRNGQAVTIRGHVDGVDPTSVAMVTQSPRMLMARVDEEIAFAGAADVDDVLRQANAFHLKDRLTAELSLGELRRVAFARALARIENGATTLILDEPTAHLDATSREAIHTALRRIPPTVRVILASHDATTRALADHTVTLGEVGITSVSEDRNEPLATLRTMLNAGNAFLPTPRDALRLISPNRKLTVTAITLGVAATISGIALTALSGWLIVRANEQPPIMYLMMAIVGVRFFGIGRAVFRYGERLALHDMILSSTGSLRLRVWHALSVAGPGAARWLRPGASLDVIVGQLNVVRDLAPRVLMPPITFGATLIVISALVLILNTTAGGILLASVLIALVLASTLTLRADRAAAVQESSERQRLRQWFGEAVSAAPDIRGNGLQDRVQARMMTIDHVLTRLIARGMWSNGLGTALTTLVIGSASVITLVVGGNAVLHGAYAPTTLAIFVLIPLAMIEPAAEMIPVVRQWPQLQRATGSVRDVLEDRPTTQNRSTWPIHALAFDHVSLRWPDMAEPVIQDLTLESTTGDWVVITGPSGSGKSTVLAATMGFLAPTSGQILAQGNRFLGRHARIAWCPQEAHIFDSTIRGNLLLARTRESAPTDDEMWAALTTVGLDNLVRDLPHGLDTRVGPSGTFLSGGQRQRLAIARTILVNADVILLDEPTAHLDSIAASTLLQELRETLMDRIVIMITHQASDIAGADTVIHLTPPPPSDVEAHL